MSSSPYQHTLFLHIPKTGGMSLRHAVARHYPKDARFEISNTINESIRELRGLPTAYLASIRLLQGHMSFGLHAHLPGSSIYFTMVREPLARARSDYLYVASSPRHPLFPAVSQMTFSEYFSSAMTSQLSNGQTRLISGDCASGDTGIPSHRDINDAGYQQALDNLADWFLVPGILERFDESLLLIRRALGWGYPLYLRENTTRDRSREPHISAADLELAAQLNRHDLALYQHCSGLLDTRVTELGDAFHTELRYFRFVNRLYQRLHALRARARQGSRPLRSLMND